MQRLSWRRTRSPRSTTSCMKQRRMHGTNSQSSETLGASKDNNQNKDVSAHTTYTCNELLNNRIRHIITHQKAQPRGRHKSFALQLLRNNGEKCSLHNVLNMQVPSVRGWTPPGILSNRSLILLCDIQFQVARKREGRSSSSGRVALILLLRETIQHFICIWNRFPAAHVCLQLVVRWRAACFSWGEPNVSHAKQWNTY